MNSYQLRATSEEHLWTVFESAGITTVDPETDEQIIARDEKRFSLVIRGVLYEKTGETLTDSEGYEYPEMTPVEGYHADLLTADQTLVDSLSEIIVTPDTPWYGWFGISN